MPTPERPFDGNLPEDGGDPSYEWLDEWLCEYVDGTMDPSLEVVFERYVEANPELKAHVRRLQRTRELLGGCDVCEEPSTTRQAEVCSAVEDDLLRSPVPLSGVVSERLLGRLSLASSVAVALVIGFLAGSILVHPATVFPAQTASTVERPQSIRSDLAPRIQWPVPTILEERASFSAVPAGNRQAGALLDADRDTMVEASTFTTVDAR